MATTKKPKKAAPAMKSAGKKKAAAKKAPAKPKRRSGYVFDGKSLKGSNKKGAGAGG